MLTWHKDYTPECNDWIFGDEIRGVIREPIARIRYVANVGYEWTITNRSNGTAKSFVQAVKAVEEVFKVLFKD